MIFIIEIILIVVIITIQYDLFSKTARKINQLKVLFPGFELTSNNIKIVQFTDSACEQIVLPNHNFSEFENIVKATNSYLKKNKGSTDFAIIKNVAERVAESQEAAVTTNIGLPLYVGLMGTFSGVIIGLGVLISKPEFGHDEIKGFIFGVIIAMVGSFFGLLFTTINNSHNLRKAKAERDRNKNNYYNFLQTELLPNLDNSLFTALDNLKINISNFNTIFSKNIESFDTTFGKKIDVLKSAVSNIAQSIDAITEGSQVQKEFLIEIRKRGYVRMAEVSIEYFEKIQQAAPLLITFIDKQRLLNNNVQQINEFAERITHLLNRVTDFENGINKLGKDLQQSDILGSDVLNLVRKHLTAIQHKEQLIEEYTIKSTDSVKQYLESALNSVEELKRKLEIHFERAFDFDVEGNVLQKLNHLTGIDQHVNALVHQGANRKIDGELNKQLSDIITLLNEIKSIQVDKKEDQEQLIETTSIALNEFSQERVLFDKEVENEEAIIEFEVDNSEVFTETMEAPRTETEKETETTAEKETTVVAAIEEIYEPEAIVKEEEQQNNEALTESVNSKGEVTKPKWKLWKFW